MNILAKFSTFCKNVDWGSKC